MEVKMTFGNVICSTPVVEKELFESLKTVLNVTIDPVWEI